MGVMRFVNIAHGSFIIGGYIAYWLFTLWGIDVLLSELFANTLGQAHLIVFGFVFILVVLFLPRGLMGGADLLHRRKMSSRPEAGREV
jgi:ABC-type branched-subunit amino acid transport system permease subunit